MPFLLPGIPSDYNPCGNFALASSNLCCDSCFFLIVFGDGDKLEELLIRLFGNCHIIGVYLVSFLWFNWSESIIGRTTTWEKYLCLIVLSLHSVSKTYLCYNFKQINFKIIEDFHRV